MVRNSEKLRRIRKNFYGDELAKDATFKHPALDKTFFYQTALFSDYLKPFVQAYYADKRTARKDAAFQRLKDKECIDWLKETEFTDAIVAFDKFVLPLEESTVEGLPLYFSPRPKASNAVTIATARHPLLQVLKHPNPRPQAYAVNTVAHAVQQIQKSQNEWKKLQGEDLNWYASVKFDGHAAIWTGKGLISKTGKAALRFVPPTMKRELLKNFGGDIVLGEIVVTQTETETIEDLRKRVTGDKRSPKANISSLYVELSDAKSQVAKERKKKVLGSLIFLAYDIISYKYRGLRFKERYDELKKKAKNLLRVEVVEQCPVMSLEVDGKGGKFPEGLAPEPGDNISPGMQQLNIMVLGCLTHNQEGIFLRPDVPFYNLYENPHQALKLKPRITFLAQVTDSPEKQSSKWYSKKGAIYEGTAVVKLPADLLLRRTPEEIGRAPLNDETVTLPFKYQGKPDLKGNSFISIANVYDKFGSRIAAPPDTVPRDVSDLLPPGVGSLAKRVYETMKADGVLAEYDMGDAEIRQFREAQQLVQLGNVLDFRDFPVVVTPAKQKALDADTSKNPPKLGVECMFPDEPNNEQLYQLLYALSIDVDLGTATSFNRWIPALRRYADGNGAAWLKLVRERNFKYAGPKMQKVDPKHMPSSVPLYYTKTDDSAPTKVFFLVQDNRALPKNVPNFYIDLKRTARRPVFFVQSAVNNALLTKPATWSRWSANKVPKDGNGDKYTAEMLEDTDVAELKSVEDGGLVEYRKGKKTMLNGGAVILYLTAVNGEQAVDGFAPANFDFS